MNCPDMERLIEVGLGHTADPGLEAHLRSCEDCQADLRTIRVLAGVGAPEREMAGDLISQIINGLPEPDARHEARWATGTQLALTWGLGFLTAVVSTVVMGAMEAGEPGTTLLLAMGFGAVCVLVNLEDRMSAPPPGHSGRSPS